MIKLSVIIPIYNAGLYIHQCLDSVVDQTLQDIEVICINDGSTDESAAIIKECATKDERIKVLTQENLGQGAARNRGLEVAMGDYVYFIDADDQLFALDALDCIVAEIKRERLDVLFFDAEASFEEDVDASVAIKKNAYIRRHDYSSVYTGRELFARFCDNREYSPSPCLAIYRRSFLGENNIRFPQERIFYEDNIFMTRVLLAAKRASHRPWRFYLRKVHAGSTVTSKPTMLHLRGYLACYRDVCETLLRKDWDAETRKALLDRRAVYKLHVRRIADSYPELIAAAKSEMAIEEYDALCKVLHYPIGEKIVNTVRCWREHGFRYTLRRIFFGRQR